MGEDKENEEEIGLEFEDFDHICDFTEGNFCPICDSFIADFEPDDYSGATEGDR